MLFLRSISVLSLAVPLATAIVGCNQSTPTDAAVNGSQSVAAATVNAYCPIMGGKVSPDANTVEWNGKVVGFCCDGCDEKFVALSDDEKAEKLAEAEAKSEDDSDHEGHQHNQ